jgi:GNAT superfamily N-acetyltransferase
VAGLVVTSVAALSDEQLARVQVIYEEAFAPDLRVPFAELSQPGHADQMFVALDGTLPAGFAALRLLESVDWTFLRYFAISRERQGQGLGRELWKLLRVAMAEESWPERTVFEVEPMLLMAAAPAAHSDRVVEGDRLKSLVLAIYTDRYGMASDDPLVSRALASIIA